MMANIIGKCLEFKNLVGFFFPFSFPLCDYFVIMRITVRHRKKKHHPLIAIKVALVWKTYLVYRNNFLKLWIEAYII